MLVKIPDVLTADGLAAIRTLLDKAQWVDGNVTSGAQAARAKRNDQLPPGSPQGKQAGDIVLDALAANPLFISAALPHRVYPPLFNRYAGGQNFGNHIDNAIRPLPGGDQRIRTDVSTTLFLNDPEDYDGGELLIEDTFGTHSVKLPARHMVVYPASSLHRVAPVTRGARLASFFWTQSMVRDDGERTLLFELDQTIQSLYRSQPDSPEIVRLTGVYHNLVRRWSQV